MDWARAALTVAFGAAAGGLTNRVAIWMLFHPHEPPSLPGGRLGWLQGAIPKNRRRLARSIGDAVGNELLTSGDLADALREEELRTAFDRRLRELLGGLLRQEHPSLSELLSEPALRDSRELLRGMVLDARHRLADWLESEAFGEDAARALAGLAEALDRRARDGPLSDEAVGELRDRADGWLRDVTGSEAFERTVRRQLREAAERVLRPGRTLEEVIPRRAVSALEAAVADYLPLAMERLGQLLEDRAARERFETAVHDLLERFMLDLRFHQRVVARLVITEETVDRVIATLEEEGAERLGELLREPEVQTAMARSVNEAIQDLLRRPAVEVVGEPDEPRVRDVLDAVAAWAVRTAREPESRAHLLDRLEEAVLEADGPTWGQLADRVPAGRLGPWAAGALRSEAGRTLARQLAEPVADRVLERPIGVPGRLLGEEEAGRLAELLAPPVWGWISDEIPRVAERIRVADRVEEKILEYPLEDLEELVRSVTQRELDLIVRLGYLLGGFIGTLLVVLDTLLP